MMIYWISLLIRNNHNKYNVLVCFSNNLLRNNEFHDNKYSLIQPMIIQNRIIFTLNWCFIMFSSSSLNTVWWITNGCLLIILCDLSTLINIYISFGHVLKRIVVLILVIVMIEYLYNEVQSIALEYNNGMTIEKWIQNIHQHLIEVILQYMSS